MTKDRVLQLSEEEAFLLGQQAHKNGHSIHYDPYRNIDVVKDNLFKIQEAWHIGWNSIS
jgi:hypothetical protein